MKIQRSVLVEPLVDFGNGCRLRSYWPPSSRRGPLLYVSQGTSAAPLSLTQVLALRDAMDELLEDNAALVADTAASDA